MMKLMKYETRRLVKELGVLWLMLLASGLLTRLLQHSGILLLARIGDYLLMFTILLAAAVLFWTIGASWLNFYRYNFREEASVLHSLPVSDRAIWWSFVLPELGAQAMTVLLASLTVWLMDPDLVAYFVKGAGTTFGISGGLFFGMIALQFWLQFSLYALCGLTGMTMGLRRKDSRLGWSVLYGLLLYTVVMLALVGLAFGLAGLRVPELFQETADQLPPEVFVAILAWLMGGYALVDAGLALAGDRVYSKGYDLE